MTLSVTSTALTAAINAANAAGNGTKNAAYIDSLISSIGSGYKAVLRREGSTLATLTFTGSMTRSGSNMLVGTSASQVIDVGRPTAIPITEAIVNRWFWDPTLVIADTASPAKRNVMFSGHLARNTPQQNFNGVWIQPYSALTTSVLNALKAQGIFNIYLTCGYPNATDDPLLSGIVSPTEIGILVTQQQVINAVGLCASVDSRFRLWAWFGTWSWDNDGGDDATGHANAKVDISTSANRTKIINALMRVANWGFYGVQDDTEDLTDNCLTSGQYNDKYVSFVNELAAACHLVDKPLHTFTPGLWYNFNANYASTITGPDLVILVMTDAYTQTDWLNLSRQFLDECPRPVLLNASNNQTWFDRMDLLPLATYPQIKGCTFYQYSNWSANSWTYWSTWKADNPTVFVESSAEYQNDRADLHPEFSTTQGISEFGILKLWRTNTGTSYNWASVLVKGEPRDVFDTYRMKFYPNYGDASTRIPHATETWIAFAFKTSPAAVIGGHGTIFSTSISNSGDSGIYAYLSAGNTLTWASWYNPTADSSRANCLDSATGTSNTTTTLYTTTLPVDTWVHVVMKVRLSWQTSDNPYCQIWHRIGSAGAQQVVNNSYRNAWNTPTAGQWSFPDVGMYWFELDTDIVGDYANADGDDPWSGAPNGTAHRFDYAGCVCTSVSTAGSANELDFFDWLNARTGASSVSGAIGDIDSGTWTCRIEKASDANVYVQGTLGPVGSGADFILTGDLTNGGNIALSPQIVMTSPPFDTTTTTNSVATILSDMNHQLAGLAWSINQTSWNVMGVPQGHVVQGTIPTGNRVQPGWSASSPFRTNTYWTHFLAWFVVFEMADSGGILQNTQTNTRIEFRGAKCLYRYRNSTTWLQHGSTTNNPGMFRASLDGQVMTPGTLDIRVNTSGNAELYYPRQSSFCVHGTWPGINALSPVNLAAVFVTVQARLIKNDGAGSDDTANAKYLLHVGGDWYPNADARAADIDPEDSIIPGCGASGLKQITSSWQAFSFVTISGAGSMNYVDIPAEDGRSGVPAITNAEFSANPPTLD